MRFLIYTQYYPPEIGAPQARLSNLARNLVARGHHVFVLTALPNYPGGRLYPGYPKLFSREEIDGVSVIRTFICPTSSIRVLPRLICHLSFLVSSFLCGLFFVPRVDFVMTEDPPIFLEKGGWLLARIKGARWILNVSDLWIESLEQLGVLKRNGFVSRAARMFLAFLRRRAWLITGQSREIIAEIRRQIPSARFYHLSNGVDAEQFNPAKKNCAIRARYLGEGEVGFVYAGLHGFFQGLDRILLAADLLRDVPARFLFFGDGPEKKRLESLARRLGLDKVSFYSPLPHVDIPQILASMDVALAPLRSTIPGAVPSKIYEAMASGIPVLLVADGEAREIVEGAGAGIAVDPGDIEALVQKIRELVIKPEMRRRMGRAGRVAAEQMYDRNKIAKEFEGYIMSLGPGL